MFGVREDGEAVQVLETIEKISEIRERLMSYNIGRVFKIAEILLLGIAHSSLKKTDDNSFVVELNKGRFNLFFVRSWGSGSRKIFIGEFFLTSEFNICFVYARNTKRSLGIKRQSALLEKLKAFYIMTYEKKV